MMRIISLLFHDVYVRTPDESGFVSSGANRYKLPLTAFDAQLDGIARARTAVPILARDLMPGSLDETLPFAVTVDDGGVSYYTAVADRLERRGWHGHCFVTTDLIGRPGFLTRSQLRELDARGHIVGSHSASHPGRFSALRTAQMLEEWTRSRSVLEDLLGHPVTVASLPGGYFSSKVAETACEAGLKLLFTSEPTTRIKTTMGRSAPPSALQQCTTVGRFTIRHGNRDDFAERLVSPPPPARYGAWASWHAKGLFKPILGPFYSHLTDWILSS